MTINAKYRGRRALVVTCSLLLGTAAGAVVVAQPAAVSAAVDLITGKYIKDGTIKKRDLAPKVRNKLGVPGPTGPAGPAGPPGPPGANAPADGAAVLMGRVANPSGFAGCITGAPSGTTNSPGCTGSGVSMPVPGTKVFRNAVFRLDAPRAMDGHPIVYASTGGGTACAIPAGQLSCTAGSFTLPAGATFYVSYSEFNQGDPNPPQPVLPSYSFSYELANPS
jgi:hypothetical protein